MICHVFGAAALVHETRDLPYAYRNESTSIPAVTGDLFPACGDAVLDARASASAAMLALKEHVNLSAC